MNIRSMSKMKMGIIAAVGFLMLVAVNATSAAYIDYSNTVWTYSDSDYDVTFAIEGSEPYINATGSSAYGTNQAWAHLFDGSGMHDGAGNTCWDGPYHTNEGSNFWHTRHAPGAAHPLGISGKAWLAVDFRPEDATNGGAILDVMDVWNFNRLIPSLLGRGLKNVRIHYDDAVTGDTVELIGTAADANWDETAGNWVFEMGTGEVNYAANTHIDFGGAFVSSVYITGLDNYSDVVDNGDYYGLSEIRFNGVAVAPVPEPAALILLGTGLVGLLAIRRRKN